MPSCRGPPDSRRDGRRGAGQTNVNTSGGSGVGLSTTADLTIAGTGSVTGAQVRANAGNDDKAGVLLKIDGAMGGRRLPFRLPVIKGLKSRNSLNG